MNITPYSLKVDLTHYQGATFSKDFNVVLGDLDAEPPDYQPITGSQTFLTVRTDREDPDDTSAIFQLAVGTGIIAVDDATGHGRATATAAQTALLTGEEYWYDLRYTPPGSDVAVVLQWGKLCVVSSSTKTVPV